MSLPVLRVARACADLNTLATRYRTGLDLVELGCLVDHPGFDGLILGEPGGARHLGSIHVPGEPAPPLPHEEQALVVYLPERGDWLRRVAAMELVGRSFAGADGGRVIMHQAAWSA